ncbi:hypothetical protein BraRD5C2_39870 [Bradyrhizobium sp. RD5-C2]|nr:hypothetical protein BraRD5C2_39870 [Bradyrhizobium sp. RD5-C2]
MRRSKAQPIRNKLDLTDRTQVRRVKKRLRLSDRELMTIVNRIGDSLSAINKQAALQGTTALQPAEAPSAAVTATVTGGEQTTTEVTAAAPAS